MTALLRACISRNATANPHPDILIERKRRFRKNTTIWVDAIQEEVRKIKLFGGMYDPWTAIASWIVALFLYRTPAAAIVSFICAVTLDEVQYILADSNKNPKDLLLLPKISKQDTSWGVYADIFTTVSSSQKKAWYVGSATGFGDMLGPSPCGLIGRLPSYFAKKAISILHEDYLRGAKGRGLTPNFRRMTDLKGYQGYHRVWMVVLEAYLMTYIGFNAKYKPENSSDPAKRAKTSKYPTVFLPEWMQVFGKYASRLVPTP